MIVRQFINWIRTAPAGERAEATRALARAWLISDLSGGARRYAGECDVVVNGCGQHADHTRIPLDLSARRYHAAGFDHGAEIVGQQRLACFDRIGDA